MANLYIKKRPFCAKMIHSPRRVFTVLTIGAGPVGLLQTIHFHLLARLKGVESKHIVYEKRLKYTRDHSVQLNTKPLQALRLQGQTLWIRTFNAILTKCRGSIKLMELEKTLRTFATLLGISVRRGVCVTAETLPTLVRTHDVSIVLDAGGAHSQATSKIFGAVNRKHDAISHKAVRMRFQRNTLHPCRAILYHPITTAHTNALTGIYGPTPALSKDKRTMTMFYIVGDFEFAALRAPVKSKYQIVEQKCQTSSGGSGVWTDFKHPVPLQDLKKVSCDWSPLLTRLQKRLWRDCTNMGALVNTPSITTVELRAYHSKCHVKSMCITAAEHTTATTTTYTHPVHCFLIGDAADGLIFEKGLNTSILTILHTSQCMLRLLGIQRQHSSNTQTAMKRIYATYEWEVRQLWRHASKYVRLKSRYIKIASFYHRMVGKLFTKLFS